MPLTIPDLFFGSHEADTAARLNEIATGLDVLASRTMSRLFRQLLEAFLYFEANAPSFWALFN
jgi:hypothetical protein